MKNYAKYDLPITEARGPLLLNYDLQTLFTKLFNIFYEFNVEAYFKKFKFHCKAFYNLNLIIFTINLHKFKNKISITFENAGMIRGLFTYRLRNIPQKTIKVVKHRFDHKIFMDLNNSLKYDNIKQSFIYLLNSNIKVKPESLLRHVDKGLLELNCLIMTTLSYLLDQDCIKLNYNLLCDIYFTILLHKESTILHNIVFNMLHNNLQCELPKHFKKYLTNYRCKNGKNVQMVHKILKCF